MREHLDPTTPSMSRPHDVARHLRWIHRHLPSLANGPLLDVGCGPGLYLASLAQDVPSAVGVDVNKAALDEASRRARGTNTRFVPWDLSLSPPVEVVDAGPYQTVVVLHSLIEALRSPLGLLQLLRRLLLPSGRILLEARQQPSYPAGRLAQWEWVDHSILGDTPHLLLTEVWATRRREIQRYARVDGLATRILQSTTQPIPLTGLESLARRSHLRVHSLHAAWTNRRVIEPWESYLAILAPDEPTKA